VDLIGIIGSLRRHWKLTCVVLTLTVLAAAWLLLFSPRQYRADASYVLVNPAPAPTDIQVEKDPSLAQVNRNNPYLRFANEGTVGQVLASRMSGNTVREVLVAQGADGGYTIAPSPSSGQIIDITGTGTSAAEAERTLELVADRMQAELSAMQRVYGADDSALIAPLPVAEPTAGHAVISGTVRSLVGVTGVGVLVLFTAISIAEARGGERRSAHAATDVAPGAVRDIIAPSSADAAPAPVASDGADPLTGRPPKHRSPDAEETPNRGARAAQDEVSASSG
jgi:hypothetical protein